ncbi:TPA: 4-hydroxy-tetrahydrodipicolinate reductase [Staphylococcus pseudintermedius]|uniref:4-hydroxy-tetrahydrodipicolinate reductase n=1 Tax=Staphylococcus pseudintermedius TaxID=283734 RepID=A0A317Z9C3_STAPS|nr:4-hydroxy-tetrahydrodipicolinate reductase [Staphylococcus pseudintermedius]ANQ88392.1 4-hydroxy-tetrahydrodipicolinate reductase [Staphylococcus pseudintermedius]AYG56703.1 4-hydroxy-tetrahydrodipicolinate reductase [Staphylococcus pseudintermedius]EGQ0365912.1 4-hydroxy-tetrahydrodipicolinate reductase [Staphylococcus pseudintermedius]EGQ2705923.1 4-hydroxy-tetrahydrodipicolinate reductase [Staphylococcus pseudintermedius]EGQ2805647.1 4-hydroxy-tetrahydrodipicolinate reductase [Staphyloco
MKILLIGYGAMNQRVARLAEANGHNIVGVIAGRSTAHVPYPIYQKISEVTEADVAIDFSHPQLLLALLEEDFTLPLVIATTGEKTQITDKLQALSDKMPVFFSANMSYGVHVLTKILEAAVPLLQDFDIELTEAHHNQKVDAPSGTLVKLYDVIESLRQDVTPVYDRSQYDAKRTKNEIGIHTVRGGTIVGEHDVLFAGTDETITLSHRAQSKDIFANGALGAAEKLIHRQPGYYTFDNL